MTGSDWNELENLLAELLERPASERNAFLDQTCAGRPALRQELTELLKAHERDSLLDSPAATLLESPREKPPVRAAMGSQVLHYQIMERLGEGEMGVHGINGSNVPLRSNSFPRISARITMPRNASGSKPRPLRRSIT